MYEELLKKYNLIIGEFFTYKGNEYLVCNNGISKQISEYEYQVDKELMFDMFMGNIHSVKRWTPNFDHTYFTPQIHNESLYESFIWLDDDSDNRFLERGIVCETPEEAVKLTQKMLEVAKI